MFEKEVSDTIYKAIGNTMKTIRLIPEVDSREKQAENRPCFIKTDDLRKNERPSD